MRALPTSWLAVVTLAAAACGDPRSNATDAASALDGAVPATCDGAGRTTALTAQLVAVVGAVLGLHGAAGCKSPATEPDGPECALPASGFAADAFAGYAELQQSILWIVGSDHRAPPRVTAARRCYRAVRALLTPEPPAGGRDRRDRRQR